jgi:hypothetical protein
MGRTDHEIELLAQRGEFTFNVDNDLLDQRSRLLEQTA